MSSDQDSEQTEISLLNREKHQDTDQYYVLRGFLFGNTTLINEATQSVVTS